MHDVGNARNLTSPSQCDGVVRLSRSRLLALAAVCTLSMGSHFTMYLLGPLKSRLHRELATSNGQFSLLIGALSLNSTWTPLVGGILVVKFGTTWSSLVTTGAVLLGQIILFIGVVHENLTIMAIGLFLFGLGVTPLMVVQETLLARLSPGGSIGISLALGLVSGKMTSFAAASLSLPLAERGGDGAPFMLALALGAVSFGANAMRLACAWGEDDNGIHKDERRQKPREVKWEKLGSLGDVFWAYIGLNVISGAIWQPFLHLSANLVQVRYDLSEATSSLDASILLAGAIVLYPVIGFVTDRVHPSTADTTFHLLQLTSTLTLACYAYLSLPPAITLTPWPGLVLFAVGHGAATLLMVVLVPRLLPTGLVPLGLGLHKAMEMASSTASQTLSGIWLDWARENDAGQSGAAFSLIGVFAIINVAQLAWTVGLWLFEKARRESAISSDRTPHAQVYEQLPLSDFAGVDHENGHDAESVNSLLLGDIDEIRNSLDEERIPSSGLARSVDERARGRIAFIVSASFIVCVWLLFFLTAWMEL